MHRAGLAGGAAARVTLRLQIVQYSFFTSAVIYTAARLTYTKPLRRRLIRRGRGAGGAAAAIAAATIAAAVAVAVSSW